MIKFFLGMIKVSAIIEMIASIVFCVGILFKNRSLSDVNVFNTCISQIKVCRVSSVIFAVLYWFVVSGMPTKECLEGYLKLEIICSILYCAWFIFALVNMVISSILGILKRGNEELEIMRKLRKSNFVMGTIFLVISYILNFETSI